MLRSICAQAAALHRQAKKAGWVDRTATSAVSVLTKRSLSKTHNNLTVTRRFTAR